MSDGEPNRYGPKGTALVPVQRDAAAHAVTESSAQTAVSAPRVPLSDIPPTAPAGVHPLTALPLNPRPVIPPTMIRDLQIPETNEPWAASDLASGPPPAPPPPSNYGGTQALPSAFAPSPPSHLPAPDDAPPITEPGDQRSSALASAASAASLGTHQAPTVSVPRPPPVRATSSRVPLALVAVVATLVIGGAATAIALHVNGGDDEPDPPIASVPTAKPRPVQADPPPSPTPTAAPTNGPTVDPRSGDPPDQPPGPRRRRRNPRNGPPRGAPPPQW